MCAVHLQVLMQNIPWCQRMLVLLNIERTIPFAAVYVDFSLELDAQPSQSLGRGGLKERKHGVME